MLLLQQVTGLDCSDSPAGAWVQLNNSYHESLFELLTYLIWRYNCLCTCGFIAALLCSCAASSQDAQTSESGYLLSPLSLVFQRN